MTFTEIINTIRDAVYGKDVRTALVELAQKTQTAVESQIASVDNNLSDESEVAASQAKATGDIIRSLSEASYSVDVSRDIFSSASNWSSPSDAGVYRHDKRYFDDGTIMFRWATRQLESVYRFDVWVYASMAASEFYRIKGLMNGLPCVLNDSEPRYTQIYVRRVDGADLSSSDKSTIRNNLKIYKSNADCIDSANAKLIKGFSGEDTTSRGISITWDNGFATLYGTNNSSDSTSIFTLDGSTANIPAWVVEGEKYHLRFDKKDRETGIESVADDVYFQILIYYSEASGKTRRYLVNTQKSVDFVLSNEVMADAVGMIFRYIIDVGKSADSTCLAQILTTQSNEELSNSVNNSTKKIRVMQHNIGDYVWGRNPNPTLTTTNYYAANAKQLTPEQYTEKLANYKRFFGKYRPDVLCLQEYNRYFYIYKQIKDSVVADGAISRASTIPIRGATLVENELVGKTLSIGPSYDGVWRISSNTANSITCANCSISMNDGQALYTLQDATTYNAGDVLFDVLYRFRSNPKDSTSETLMFSNSDISNFRNVGLLALDRVSYTDSISWRFSDLDIGTNKCIVATGPLNASNASDGQSKREAQWFYLMNYILSRGYTYAIICSDINAGNGQASAHESRKNVTITTPDGDTTLGAIYPEYDDAVGDAETNFQAIVNIAKYYGYKACNSADYWGIQGTYVPWTASPPAPNINQPLDGIFTLGNIKVTNFEVLVDEYSNLASDHIPVIADLVIY